jgi:hypothetical protein
MAQADYGNGTTHDFCISSVGVDENDISTLVNVFPNPAKDHFSILLGDNELEIASVNVVDIRGAVVLNETNIQQAVQTNINVSNLSQGVYFVNILTNQGTVTKKLVLK